MLPNDPPGRHRTPPGGPVAPAVAALSETLTELTSETRRLRGDALAADRARRRASNINLGVLAVVGVLVVLLLAVGWQNNRLTRQVNETNERVADCTTPGGRCFEDGRARTGTAVGSITRVIIAVEQCAHQHRNLAGADFDRAVESCVTGRLTAPSPSPGPQPSGSPSGSPTRR